MSSDLCFSGSYLKNELYCSYHQNEWGKSIYSSNMLFEALCLEIFQSGLSWLTILTKRQDTRKAFCNFNVEVAPSFDEEYISTLLKTQKLLGIKRRLSQ